MEVKRVTNDLCVTPEVFQKLQEQDVTLEKIRQSEQEELTGMGVKFFCERWADVQEMDSMGRGRDGATGGTSQVQKGATA